MLGLFYPRAFVAAFLFIICAGSAHAQKVLSKTVLNPAINSININGELCYRVILETADTEEVTVEARMEGEYRSDLLVLFHEDGNTLYIETEFGPEFRLPNDKLGAHKVISASMRVILPRDENTVLTARSCEVRSSGRFRNLEIVFNDGSCHLEHSAENTEVRTGSAPISASVPSGEVKANSRYGDVKVGPLPMGDHHMNLLSVSGDITVN